MIVQSRSELGKAISYFLACSILLLRCKNLSSNWVIFLQRIKNRNIDSQHKYDGQQPHAVFKLYHGTHCQIEHDQSPLQSLHQYLHSLLLHIEKSSDSRSVLSGCK